MQFSLLTYNTLLNDAQKGLHLIFNKYNPDLVCLQEMDTDAKNIEKIEKLGYSLADYSNGFIKFIPPFFIYYDIIILELYNQMNPALRISPPAGTFPP